MGAQFINGDIVTDTAQDARNLAYPVDEEYDTMQDEIDTINQNLTAQDNLVFKFGTDGDGNYGFYKADDSFVPFRKEPNWVVNPEKGNIDTLTFDGLVVGQQYAFSSYGILQGVSDTTKAEVYSLSGGTIDNQTGFVYSANYMASMIFTAINKSVTISLRYSKNGSYNKFIKYCF